MNEALKKAMEYVKTLSQKEIDERFDKAYKEIEKINFTNNSDFVTFLNIDNDLDNFRKQELFVTFAA